MEDIHPPFTQEAPERDEVAQDARGLLPHRPGNMFRAGLDDRLRQAARRRDDERSMPASHQLAGDLQGPPLDPAALERG